MRLITPLLLPSTPQNINYRFDKCIIQLKNPSVYETHIMNHNLLCEMISLLAKQLRVKLISQKTNKQEDKINRSSEVVW